VHFLIPGPLDQLTGGYLFARRVIAGLREMGRPVHVAELQGSFPEGDTTACASVAAALAGLPDGAVVVLDGLALPASRDCLAQELRRLRIAGFVHHPLALETGLTGAETEYYAAIEANLAPWLHGVLCPSRLTAQELIRYGVAGDRIAVIAPGTAKAVGPRPRTAIDGSLRLLTVATLTPRKGHRLLVEALADLRALDWRLLCLGSLSLDPATVAAVRDEIRRQDLGTRIELAGEWAPERMPEAYLAADCFVLPSFYEGYGMAFAEALRYGLPIIGTKAGAIPDTVPDAAGILVPPGDVPALAEALRRIIEDGALRERLAEGARRAGAALLDWPETVRLWSDSLDRLMGLDIGGPAPPASRP
jgi:glycosyltransferase involved in cell wall biosynthesis